MQKFLGNVFLLLEIAENFPLELERLSRTFNDVNIAQLCRRRIPIILGDAAQNYRQKALKYSVTHVWTHVERSPADAASFETLFLVPRRLSMPTVVEISRRRLTVIICRRNNFRWHKLISVLHVVIFQFPQKHFALSEIEWM